MQYEFVIRATRVRGPASMPASVRRAFVCMFAVRVWGFSEGAAIDVNIASLPFAFKDMFYFWESDWQASKQAREHISKYVLIRHATASVQCNCQSNNIPVSISVKVYTQQELWGTCLHRTAKMEAETDRKIGAASKVMLMLLWWRKSWALGWASADSITNTCEWNVFSPEDDGLRLGDQVRASYVWEE